MSALLRLRSLDTPVGRLLLQSGAWALVRIEWSDQTAADPDPLLDRATEQLHAYFAGSLRRFDLPLASEGSAFQRRAWVAMCEIPYGQTWTYGELATRIGGVARALGQACGANPIPIVIPCHRVLGAGGKLGGYSGGRGPETKQLLLDLERGTPGLPLGLEPGAVPERA